MSDLVVIAASNGDNLKLAGRFAAAAQANGLFNARPVALATHSGGNGHGVLTALRLQLAYLGAHVVGRQLVSNRHQPAQDDSITDLISRLQHLHRPQS